MSTKAERKAEVQAEIRRICEDVDEQYWPSPWQFQLLRNDVDWMDGADPDGYFLGRCVLARFRGDPVHPARYNFHKGVMRCDPDEDRPSCHEEIGRTISLVNGLNRG